MKRNVIFSAFLVIVISALGAYGLFYENDQKVQADQIEEKQNDDKAQERENSISLEATKSISDGEETVIYLESYNEIMNSHYKEIELTEDEAKNWVNVIHNYIDLNIGLYNQGDFNASDPDYMLVKDGLVKGFISQFIALDENYNFENVFHNDMAKELHHYFERYAKGDINALFGLKNTIFELDLEINPDLYKQDRATYISLTDAERIRNGIEPLGVYNE